MGEKIYFRLDTFLPTELRENLDVICSDNDATDTRAETITFDLTGTGDKSSKSFAQIGDVALSREGVNVVSDGDLFQKITPAHFEDSLKVRCEKTYLTVTTHTSKNPTHELTHKERQKASFRAGLLFRVRESKKTPEKADGSVLVKHEGKVIALYSVAVFYDLSVNAETFSIIKNFIQSPDYGRNNKRIFYQTSSGDQEAGWFGDSLYLDVELSSLNDGSVNEPSFTSLGGFIGHGYLTNDFKLNIDSTVKSRPESSVSPNDEMQIELGRLNDFLTKIENITTRNRTFILMLFVIILGLMLTILVKW